MAQSEDTPNFQVPPGLPVKALGLPKTDLFPRGMAPVDAKRLIAHDLSLDGNALLNLATFVTTSMEPEADDLMALSFNKNMIDKDEYPETAKIEERCVQIVTNLFHAPEPGVGTSAIGSSEAVMLCGLAMKWRWRARREKAGQSTDRPNLVMGTNVQVVWEKFCKYWDVEARYVPVKNGKYTIAPQDAVALCDENTIGVIAILGTTYTGEFEPIEAIHDAVVALNEQTGWEVPVHVDAASGGFVAPFIHPDLPWDFRLPNVVSINVSGHKYGLVYPGVGWAAWRSKEYLPEDLVFHVKYLGGDMPTFTLNFSRPGNQIIGQYYNFVRYGFEGYQAIMGSLQWGTQQLAATIADMGPFHVISDGTDIPVIAFSLKETDRYTVYDVSSRLRLAGWQVPAYPLPADADDIHVLRIVVRLGMSLDMAETLADDLKDAVDFLEQHGGSSEQARGFSH
ncbi:MAG: glutamate decarboxylase [Actinobacteria bacterium]|nr:glutamate decarboxylase [Actinomycetota bacterium]